MYKKISLLAFIVLMSTLFASIASAYNYQGYKWAKPNATLTINVCFDSSMNTAAISSGEKYSTLAYDAYSVWTSSVGGKIQFTTNSSATCQMNNLAYDYGTTEWNAYTYPNATTGFVSYVYYQFNRHYMDGKTYSKDRAVMEHEIGHGIGLGHMNDTPTSIMCQELYGRTATAPITLDINAVKSLYGF